MSAQTQIFDFDRNPVYRKGGYDSVARRTVPGYDSIFGMALTLLSLSLTMLRPGRLS